ncbi:unnamed protein product [Rhizoctonia solani]|uniref:Mediator of RNA polymerase II transcription subunit 8 n=1 Tax=Rhizoctonia solani TaxID=456999 RepID=A0A8H3B6Y2_9AGAM|nr:unnamed protein product [Rhizoctonia solani]
MSIPAPAPPPPIPDPKLDPTGLSSQLPQAQIENLKYKIIQIMEGINGLLVTLNTGGMQLAGWPDLMNKYNVLLSKTHTLAASLSTPPTRKGMIGFRQIVPTPFAVNGPSDSNAPNTNSNPNSGGTTNPAAPATTNPVVPGAMANPAAPGAPNPETSGLDPQLDAMLEALLDGRRSMSVTKTDVANVARLHLPGSSVGAGLGIGMGGTGAVGETVPPDVMLARLEGVRKAHDARCARGVEAVRQLKDKYDWKSRLLFDDSDSESSIAVASHHSSEGPGSVGGEDEDMVEVAPPPDEDLVQIEEEGDTPTQTRVFVPVAEDSDSDSDEEVQVNVNVGEGVGGEEGSDSDGMEDVSVPPPSMYQNGPQQQQQQPPPQPQAQVSALDNLDNLWVIDQ